MPDLAADRHQRQLRRRARQVAKRLLRGRRLGRSTAASGGGRSATRPPATTASSAATRSTRRSPPRSTPAATRCRVFGSSDGGLQGRRLRRERPARAVRAGATVPPVITACSAATRSSRRSTRRSTPAATPWRSSARPTAGCKGGASVENAGEWRGRWQPRPPAGARVLGGNQVIAPISAPINICGNSVAVFGQAFAGLQGRFERDQRRAGHPATTRAPRARRVTTLTAVSGSGSGNQVIAPISLPIMACGNAVGNAHAGVHGRRLGARTPARCGAGGNRTPARVRACSAATRWSRRSPRRSTSAATRSRSIGKAFAGCKGGASVKNGGRGGAGGNTTSGKGSVLGGNQVVAPITAPINACGNAVAVLGLAGAHCKGGASVKNGGRARVATRPPARAPCSAATR